MDQIRNGVTWKWVVGILIALVLAGGGTVYKELFASVEKNKQDIAAIHVGQAQLEIKLYVMQRSMDRMEEKLDRLLDQSRRR